MKELLKWLCVLPGAIAASVLSFAIGSLIGYVSTRFFIVGEDGRWIWAISRLIANILAGYVFVYVGTMIAPRYKHQISVTLCGVVLIMVTVGITLQLVLHTVNGFWDQVEVYTGGILAFIGALTGFESVKSGTDNNDSQITNKTSVTKRREQTTLWHHKFGIGDKISLKMEEGGTCIGVITALDSQRNLYIVTFEDEVSLMPAEEPVGGWGDNGYPQKTHKLTENEYMLIANRKIIGTTLHYHF